MVLLVGATPEMRGSSPRMTKERSFFAIAGLDPAIRAGTQLRRTLFCPADAWDCVAGD
jgi:hypothetical protein